MQLVHLESIDDPQVEAYTNLTELQLRNRLEPSKGIFIAESPKVITRALAAGRQPISLLVEEPWIEGMADIFAFIDEHWGDDIPVYVASPEQLRRITGYRLHRGALAAMHRWELPTVAEVCANATRIAVLEKESDVCTQTSRRNTGMLHAGFLYKTSSLKAICAVEGNQEFDQVARELDVPFKRTGKLIVSFTDEHRQRLEQFMVRGEANGVKGLELLARKRMDELDPSDGDNFTMWCQASGILDPFLYTIALAENAVHNGAEYHLNCAFTGETRQADGTHLLHTTRGDFHTRWVVNSAGLNSAVVSGQLGIPGYVIKPVKGEYFVLDKLAGQFAKIPVYPAPNPDNTFDTHATPTVDGNVLVGPDSQLARDFQDYESTQAAMDGLIESGSRMFKHMDRAYFIRNFAGIRPKRIDPATGAVQDFVLECRDEAPGVVNLVGIESPGVTSALPLARRAVALIARQEALEPNPDFDPIRHGIRRFADMTDEERAAAIAENPDYGEIFCRCEKVTKAEILQAIHNPLGVHTVNGIKVRTRATMGRCQGGYCETRITEALHRELGEDFRDIHLGPEGSWMFTGSVKGGEPA